MALYDLSKTVRFVFIVSICICTLSVLVVDRSKLYPLLVLCLRMCGGHTKIDARLMQFDVCKLDWDCIIPNSYSYMNNAVVLSFFLVFSA
jgi:hypothetical protein